MPGAGRDHSRHRGGIDPSGDPHRPRGAGTRSADVAEAGSCPTGLGRRGHDRTGREVVDGGPGAGRPMAASSSLGRVGREADEGVLRPPRAAPRSGEMSSCPTWTPSAPDGRGQIGSVVEDEGHVVVGADPLDQRRPAGQLGGRRGASRGAGRRRPRRRCRRRRSARGPVGRECRGTAAGRRGPSATGRGRPRAAQPGVDALAAAWPWPSSCCLYWRTLARASGESMSATDRMRPGSPYGAAAFSHPGGRTPSCFPSERDEDARLLLAETGQRLHVGEELPCRRRPRSRWPRRRRRRSSTMTAQTSWTRPAIDRGKRWRAGLARTPRPGRRGPWRRWRPRRAGRPAAPGGRTAT